MNPIGKHFLERYLFLVFERWLALLRWHKSGASLYLAVANPPWQRSDAKKKGEEIFRYLESGPGPGRGARRVSIVLRLTDSLPMQTRLYEVLIKTFQSAGYPWLVALYTHTHIYPPGGPPFSCQTTPWYHLTCSYSRKLSVEKIR